VTNLLKELKEKLVDTLKLADVYPEEIGDDKPLFGEGLGLDSSDGLELVLMLESNYGIKIDSKDLGHRVFALMCSMADFGERSRAGKTASAGCGCSSPEWGWSASLAPGVSAVEVQPRGVAPSATNTRCNG